MVYVSLVRSPHAHARIRRIDAAAARKEPGVVTIVTGKDAEATGVLPVFITVPGLNGTKHMPLATDKARYAGEPRLSERLRIVLEIVERPSG